MMDAGLYHSSHDTEWADVNTMWKAMFDAVTLDGGTSTSAPAGDVREVYAVDDQGLFCRHCGRTSARHFRTKAGNFCRNPEDFPEAITPAVDAVPAGEVGQ